MALSDKHTECAQCGMVCAPNEYHPYAACLMFMACKDGPYVRANLAEVRKQDTELIRQMLDALETVDGAMPFPVARQVLKVARARLGAKP